MQAYFNAVFRLIRKKKYVYALIAFFIVFVLVNQLIMYWITQSNEDQQKKSANKEILVQFVSTNFIDFYFLVDFR